VEEIYRKLARRLDLTSGFPATESGIELKLLAMVFTPEQAALAAEMRLTPEPAAQIANRAGMDAGQALSLLQEMADRKLIERVADGEPRFALMPVLISIFEDYWLPRMGKDLALPFEQYYRETQGLAVGYTPSPHRVIPVAEAVPAAVEVAPYQQAAELIECASSWAVRPCICRLQQRLVGKGCDWPIDTCLVFAYSEGAFDDSEFDRPVDREEALQVLRRAGEQGLVLTTGNFRDGVDYICSCCTCCCMVLRALAEFDVPTAVTHSDFRVAVDEASCVGCGDCVARCQFNALSMVEDVSTVDWTRCVGCGVCTLTCPSGALALQRRPEEEIVIPPRDLKEWAMRRADARGIPREEIA